MSSSLENILHVEPELPSTGPDTNVWDPGISARSPAVSTSAASAVPRKRPAPRGTAAYPRRRAIRACETCRSRRTRCDNKKPTCSFCEKVGAKCVTSPTGLSSYVKLQVLVIDSADCRDSFDPASLVIIERLDKLEQLVRSQGGSDAAEKQSPASKDHYSPSDNESPISDPPGGNDFSTFTIETVLSWPVFQNRFDLRLDLKALLQRIPEPADEILALQTENFIAKDLRSDACTRLLNTFLEHVHPANPILDISVLCQYFNDACVSGIGWTAESCLVVSSVYF